MTRNERKKAARERRNAIEALSLQAIAADEAKKAEQREREARIASYPTATIWSSRGQDKHMRERTGIVINRGGTKSYIPREPKLPVERPTLKGEALRIALETGTIGEKMKRPIGKSKR